MPCKTRRRRRKKIGVSTKRSVFMVKKPKI